MRAATLLVLTLLWVLMPFLAGDRVSLAALHMALVALLLGLAAVVAARSGTLSLGLPWWATLLACASLALAVERDPSRFPIDARWWTAHTGWAHALTFLAGLVLVPARGELADDYEHRFFPELRSARGLRQGLVFVLLLLILVQAAAMLPQVRAGERPTGSLGNPNILGATLAAAGLALSAFCRWRVPALLPVSAVLAMTLATGSRGALAATGLVLLLLGLRRGPRQVLGVLVALAVVLLVVPNPLTERVLALRSGDHFSRAFFWDVALQNIAANPLGIGPGMNRFVFPPLALDPAQPWLLHQRHAVGLTHNLLLTLTLEWGWAAGAAALALLGWALRRLLPRGAAPDALGQGAALGAAVLLLEAQVDGVEQNPLACSLMLFLGAAALRRLPGEPLGLKLPGRLVALGLLALALGLGVQAGRRALRDDALSGARRAVAAYSPWSDAAATGGQGTGERGAAGAARGALGGSDSGLDARTQLLLAAQQAVTRAERQAPDAAEAHLQRFLLLEARLMRALDAPIDDAELLAGWARQGNQALLRAQARDPADPWLWRCSARAAIRIYRHAGRSPDQLEAFFEAMGGLLARDPLDVAARWELAQEAQRAGYAKLQEAHCKALLALEPDDALAWFALGVLRRLRGETEGAAAALQRALEAVYNCRIQRAIESPASRAYYDKILERVPLETIRRAQAALRRELYG
ncbi:MAG: hypothetical protein DRQ55_16385 [Planctomycetota bacterium]|nr:MAG: hypothetical protein DRQ55_16385 [Planctomycetota bacterium]